MADRRGDAATEKPTPERRREARRLGQVAISADLTAAWGLAAALAALVATASAGVARLVRYFRGALEHAVSAVGFADGGADAAPALASAGGAALAAVVPVIAIPLMVVMSAVLGVGALQTRGLFAWPAARPSFDRVSPRAGLRRLFGAGTAGSMGRSLLKIVLVVAATATVLAPSARVLPGLVRAKPAAILAVLGELGSQLAVRLVVALAAWGVLDWALARWRLERDLAMTPDEVKRERRAREGEPIHRAERRRLHRQLGEQATPDDVRAATFIVIGGGQGQVPMAVAVAYGPTSGRAPVVVVAGRRALAARMQSVAREVGVPIHHDTALVEALIDVPPSEEIPDACFEAVAALLP